MTRYKVILCASSLALLCCELSRGQTVAPATPAPTGAVRADLQRVPLAVTWNYYPQPKSLVLHLVNNSGKNITSYNISVKNKYTDGTHDDPCCLQHQYNMLNRQIEIETAKDPVAQERRERELGDGVMFAGAARDVVLHETKDVSDVEAVADVVFYSDATFDEQNADTFRLMLAQRQRRLLTIKKVISAIDGALANKADDHPSAAALAELTKIEVEQTVKYAVYQTGMQYDPEKGLQFQLMLDIQNLQHYVQADQKGTTERDRLTQYGEFLKSEVEALTPHCHLEILPALYRQ
jgi:hypothetical protein